MIRNLIAYTELFVWVVGPKHPLMASAGVGKQAEHGLPFGSGRGSVFDRLGRRCASPECEGGEEKKKISHGKFSGCGSGMLLAPEAGDYPENVVPYRPKPVGAALQRDTSFGRSVVDKADACVSEAARIQSRSNALLCQARLLSLFLQHRGNKCKGPETRSETLGDAA